MIILVYVKNSEMAEQFVVAPKLSRVSQSFRRLVGKVSKKLTLVGSIPVIHK